MKLSKITGKTANKIKIMKAQGSQLRKNMKAKTKLINAETKKLGTLEKQAQRQKTLRHTATASAIGRAAESAFETNKQTNSLDPWNQVINGNESGVAQTGTVGDTTESSIRG